MREWIDYDEYINSDRWREKREEAFIHHGRWCARCKATWNLHVHHRTYESLGDEHMKDLEILCAECHERHHLMESSGQVVEEVNISDGLSSKQELDQYLDNLLREDRRAAFRQRREEESAARNQPWSVELFCRDLWNAIAELWNGIAK